MKIEMYSTNCPQCKVLEQKLKEKNIEFDLINDTNKVIEKGLELNIAFVPFMVIEDRVYNFKEAIDWVKEQ